MKIVLEIRNESQHKRLYRRADLTDLAERICSRELSPADIDAVEVSLLFCDDGFMAELNEQYRGKRGPTDVLSFEQDGPDVGKIRLLGDIIVSLETVDARCAGDRAAMRDEVRLLFCHGMLHLLGYDHGTRAEEEEMIAKQAQYLDVEPEAAWQSGR